MKRQLLNEMKLTLPSKSVNEGYARYAVSAFIGQLDPTVADLGDIRTAVSEAVTNCVVHAYREREGKIYICAKYYDDGKTVITIRDKGCGMPDVKKAMEPLYTTDTTGERGGMGFAIMESFMDRLKVRSSVGFGTSVTMTKRIKK
ncbi:MAG: anti-sigma F factor [Clostridia bacterium]|nr:anti-sigma F factor [Clostridia bacterium]